MDKCGICDKPAAQLFETGNEGVYACFKCQPLVPEVTIEDSATDPPDLLESQNSNSDEESNDKTLSCGICHKSFQKGMQLQNHMRNHRAERRFVCTYCNKAFSQSNNLRAHLRIHTNERPFKCNDCGKAFTQVTNLNNHVRLHTGERPFVCPEPGCNKAYAQETPKGSQDTRKRRRERNYTPEERQLLTRLIAKYPIVESKKVNGKSIAMKRAAWSAITEEYNRINRSVKHMTFKVEIVPEDDNDETGLDSTTFEESTLGDKNDYTNDTSTDKEEPSQFPPNYSNESQNDKEDKITRQIECTQNTGQFRNRNSRRRIPSTTADFARREAFLRMKFLQSKQKMEMQLLKAQVTNLNQHRKRHLNGRPVEATYDCNICGEQFQQRNHMYTHRREAHGDARGPPQRCGICDAVLPSERLLRLHVAQHASPAQPQQVDHDSKGEDDDSDGTMTCVFSSCGAVVRSAREHTEHLLRAHQLRVLAAPARARRGRPPKHQELKDPLDLNDFKEVKIIKRSGQPQYIPKLKVQSLFQ